MSTFLEACKEYCVSRSSDKVLCRWLCGSAAAVAVALLTAPSRESAMARVNSTKREIPVVKQKEEEEEEKEDKEDKGGKYEEEFNKRKYSNTSISSFKRFLFLLRLAFPSLRSQESGMLLIVSVLLLLRTYLSLRISRISGKLSRDVISCDPASLVKSLIVFFMWCIPTALTNSSIRFCMDTLSLQLQLNVTRYFHEKYLDNKVFFHLAGSHDVEEVDQRITQDIDQWSRNVTSLYTSLFKPIVDIILFSYRVILVGGARSPLLVFAYYNTFAAIAYVLSPNIEEMVDEQLARNGALVTAHQRLIPFAEEVVMTGGQTFHEDLMNRYLSSIVRYDQWASFVRSRYALIETIFLKYGSSVLGYAICGAAVFSKNTEGMSAVELTGIFVETSYLFRNLALAVGDLLKSVKKCFVLRALSNRVYALQEGILRATAEVNKINNSNNGSGSGEIARGEHIEFENVSLILPTREVLCKGLSFYVKPGMNLLIVGPNGCGKSSTVRLLGGLWPLESGRIIKPRNDQIYYVPQRPYMSSGTLRDQITYPQLSSEIGVSESTLLDCLEKAMVDDILLKPNITLDSRLSWADDTLSMGEKQKIAMARLFFHRPRFAILDECSSMMDLEVEEQLYSMCRQLGISLITIAHRRSVWRHHNWILRFDGEGGFMFSPISFEEDGNIVLTRVVYASDPSLLQTTVRLDLSQYNE
ncbi:70 kDa peroxisomal membrane protein [Trypanosoma theileri]|uniref:70 kDa peroxisomal membrane protein n=1 Tax=Trypanosoma theileri TaxID=67003 RepID=A0A1X0NJ54_9TRYP|nr:70 kDa peroxisomal membrane protein [Trypanosoma theileri]ORC84782.1 70 kDa peroxisomal membrane protein [Trypanosoma theileri]